MNQQPHASWAHIYDRAYELSFGSLYDNLTEHTIAVVQQVLGPDGNIVDLGAGTGRLTLPLLDRGYSVTSVEPCQAMADELQKKRVGTPLDIRVAKMVDFHSPVSYDMALCVFTVIAYMLNPDELAQSLTNVYESLRPGGLLLLEVPSRILFQGHSAKSPQMSRTVQVSQKSDVEFEYNENIRQTSDSGYTETSVDIFTIRYWPMEEVKKILTRIGFIIAVEHSVVIERLGSDYVLLRKP